MQEDQSLSLSDDNQTYTNEQPPLAVDQQEAANLLAVEELLGATHNDLAQAFERATRGIATIAHQLDHTVVFMLDNHQEVSLRVRKIEVEHAEGEVLSLKVFCRTDFENVLILAKRLNMRIAAFATWFTVILSAEPEFIQTWQAQILELDHPSKFFETLDELKRPIFLNLNHYIIARISD